MERWGENSLYVEGSPEWASLPPAQVYQRGWLRRGARGNTASTIAPAPPLPSASPTHRLLQKCAAALLPPRSSVLLWQGRGGPVSRGMEAALGSLSNKREELLTETRHSWRETVFLSDVLKWAPGTVLKDTPTGPAMAMRSVDNVPGQRSHWKLNGRAKPQLCYWRGCTAAVGAHPTSPVSCSCGESSSGHTQRRQAMTRGLGHGKIQGGHQTPRSHTQTFLRA